MHMPPSRTEIRADFRSDQAGRARDQHALHNIAPYLPLSDRDRPVKSTLANPLCKCFPNNPGYSLSLSDPHRPLPIFRTQLFREEIRLPKLSVITRPGMTAER